MLTGYGPAAGGSQSHDKKGHSFPFALGVSSSNMLTILVGKYI